MRDPKFGYHWIWLAPVAIASMIITQMRLSYKQNQTKRRIAENRKNDKDLDDLCKLARDTKYEI